MLCMPCVRSFSYVHTPVCFSLSLSLSVCGVSMCIWHIAACRYAHICVDRYAHIHDPWKLIPVLRMMLRRT